LVVDVSVEVALIPKLSDGGAVAEEESAERVFELQGAYRASAAKEG
jgi:hypothetical protein